MQNTHQPERQNNRIELPDQVAKQLKREAAEAPSRIARRGHVLADGIHLAIRYEHGDWHLGCWCEGGAKPTVAEANV